jgi:hypothetical protein
MAGYFPSRSRIRYVTWRGCVVEVRERVPGCLGDPCGGRVGGGAEDAYLAGGVFDDGLNSVECPWNAVHRILIRRESSLALGFHRTYT